MTNQKSQVDLRYYAVTHLNSKYFQKSTFFLYPLLKIPKLIIPKGTYLTWGDKYKLEDNVLICVYEKFIKPAQLESERKYLLGHPLYLGFHELEDGNIVYVFSFKNHSEIIKTFIKGRYSKFSKAAKERIISFYKPNGGTIRFMNSYLHPVDYHRTYSELLDVDIKLLEEVVELINIPDLNKENLTSLEKGSVL